MESSLFFSIHFLALPEPFDVSALINAPDLADTEGKANKHPDGSITNCEFNFQRNSLFLRRGKLRWEWRRIRHFQTPFFGNEGHEIRAFDDSEARGWGRAPIRRIFTGSKTEAGIFGEGSGGLCSGWVEGMEAAISEKECRLN